MKIFIAVLVLIFSLQSLIKADDIRDFQIEGMSIGDSLLNYMTTSQIKKNQIDYGGKRKYYATKYDGDLSIYDRIEIWLKSGDENYRIYGITTGIYYEKNLSDCLAKKKIIVNDLEKLFENLKFTDNEKNHDAYNDSRQYTSYVYLGNSNDNIRVECIVFGKETKKQHGFWDHLSVLSQSREIVQWSLDGYK